MTLDEGTLRERFPEIPWDQPVAVTVPITLDAGGVGPLTRWVCRYCIAMHGLSARRLIEEQVPYAWKERVAALDHIEREHHD